MFSDLPCAWCEKIVVELEHPQAILNLFDAPNTFDIAERSYLWQEYDLMKYVLVPRLTEKNKAWVDLYLCVDEDDLDDLDLFDYVKKFLVTEILPRWNGFRLVNLVPAVMAEPDVGCWRIPQKKFVENV